MTNDFTLLVACLSDLRKLTIILEASLNYLIEGINQSIHEAGVPPGKILMESSEVIAMQRELMGFRNRKSIMKHILLSAVLFISGTCLAQDEVVKLPTGPEGGVQFQEVVQIDSSTSAKELISRARTWAGKAYKSANTVVQNYDADAGVLVIKGVMQHSGMA